MLESRILVVDDEEAIRELMVDILSEDTDYGVHTAGSGEEALEICAEVNFDLVFTDLRMPGMSGSQLLGALKQKYPWLPVVIITGYGSREDVIEALQLGASNFLLKPLQVELISSLATRLISLRNREKLSDQIMSCLVEERRVFCIPSDLHYTLGVIDRVTQSMERLAVFEDAELKNIRLALDEALVNAIVHGNLEVTSKEKGNTLTELVAYDDLVQARSTEEPYCKRCVRITSDISGEGVQFVVEDEGAGFDTRSLPRDFADVDNLTSHGRGLLLIKTFMDRIYFNEKGNCITMIKRNIVNRGQGAPRSDHPPLANDPPER